MMPGVRSVVVVFAVVACAVVCSACDVRPTLAQFALFSGYREDLAAQCCDCLARRGTSVSGASCSEGVLVEGELVLPDSAIVATGAGVDDLDDEIGDNEIPCSCGVSGQACINQLIKGETITIPGACVDQPTTLAACESECAGVLSFEPITAVQ